MWIELQADYFIFMAIKGMIALSSSGVPDLDNFRNLSLAITFAVLSKDPVATLSLDYYRRLGKSIPKGVVESDSIDNILMSLKSEQLFSQISVPNFAGSIIASSDES
jgi:hypothetical protein